MENQLNVMDNIMMHSTMEKYLQTKGAIKLIACGCDNPMEKRP